MRRRRTDPLQKKLRQLVHNGRRSEILQLLQETLRQNPHHAMAREELTRHLTGRPYTFEEKLYTELQHLLSDFLSTPGMLTNASSRVLRQMRKRLHYLQRELGHQLTEANKKVLTQLKKGIARELKRRRNHLGRALSIAFIGSILLLLGGGYYSFLDKRAEDAAMALHAACKCEHTSIETAAQLLSVHDTGLNRTLNRNVSTGAERLRAHIRAAQQRSRQLDSILRAIERGQQSVVGQGVRRRAEIERMLKLPCSRAEELAGRWAALCQAENVALNQQRLALSEEILSPLPVQAALCGKLEEDIEAVVKFSNLLQQRLFLFEDAGETLGISPEAMKPVQDELARATRLVSEMKGLQQTLKLLPTAHDYASYRARLEELPAQHYTPAIELREILQQMPAEDTIRGMMQEHGQNLRPGLLQASRRSLLEGGPSFSREFPATREQLHILDELLSNSALQTRIYELTDTAENQHAYAEQLPELRNGRVCFQRSSLDPERKESQDKTVEWHTPHAILSREIDPRPLHTGLGLNKRSGFHSTVNLPHLLTQVFRIEGPRIPALARAYVFQHLVMANAAAAEPILSGLRFAPAMRQRIKEFEALKQECNIALDGDCWLRNSAQHTAAERKYARWFNKHQKCDFADELKRNLGALLHIAPRFCGYINEHSSPILFEEVEKGQLIWYMGTDGVMTTSPYGDELQQPKRLSPVFSVERRF